MYILHLFSTPQFTPGVGTYIPFETIEDLQDTLKNGIHHIIHNNKHCAIIGGEELYIDELDKILKATKNIGGYPQEQLNSEGDYFQIYKTEYNQPIF